MIRRHRFTSVLETLEKLFFLLVSHLQPWKNGNEDATPLPYRGVTRIGKAMCAKHLELCLLSDLQHPPLQPLVPPFMCCFLWS